MVAVACVDGSHRLVGDGSLVEFANRWLGHLEGRQFAPGTIRGYAFDLLCLARFFSDAAIDWREATPTDFFDQERRLPESLDAEDVAVFLADRQTHRDRAIVLLMLLGGLRAAEVRSLRLTDIDVGLRQVKVAGKGSKLRVVPVDRAFFSELTAYLRAERPQGASTAECFVVLRGPTAGDAMTEAGLRRIFRTHRARTGAQGASASAAAHLRHRARLCRHRPAGVARAEGHAHAETTAAYVHLAPETVAAEWARAKQVLS
jgi:site-specific recombinase XerD